MSTVVVVVLFKCIILEVPFHFCHSTDEVPMIKRVPIILHN